MEVDEWISQIWTDEQIERWNVLFESTPKNDIEKAVEYLNEANKKHWSCTSGGAIECSNPGWEGLWEWLAGHLVKVVWNGRDYIFDLGGMHWQGAKLFTLTEYDEDTGDWAGPIAEGWEMIEPAPYDARAHVSKKEEMANDWDPYYLG
jgi:hypothetical protein